MHMKCDCLENVVYILELVRVHSRYCMWDKGKKQKGSWWALGTETQADRTTHEYAKGQKKNWAPNEARDSCAASPAALDQSLPSMWASIPDS